MTAGDFILYTTNLPDTAGKDMVAMNGYSKVPCDGRDHDVIFVIGAVKFTPGMTKCLSVAELLVTKAAFSSFTNNPVLGGLRVYFNQAPYVVQRYYGEDSISTTFVDVTGLYKFFTNPTILQVIEKQIAAGQTDMEKAKALADLLKQFNARVKGLNDLVTSYNYKDLIAMFVESHRMFLGEDDRCVVATDFLMNENTREFDEYNAKRRKVKAFDYVSSQEVKQDVEDSRLWFYVPTLAQLKISGGEGFKPSWEFGDHYNSSIFRSDLYMIFTEGHWDKVEFLQYCKRTPASGGRRGTLFSGYDVEDESAFLDHEPMEVLGNPENNMLPLQENEQAIRTALVNMVKSSIVNMLEERGEEVTDERVESLYAMNVIPAYTKQYLDSLLEYFLQVNWMHTGKVPQMFDSMDGVEDPEDGPDSFYGYAMSNASSLDGFNPTDALQLVTTELFTQAKKLGVDLYVDTIIRIARWGSRKPTKIPIGWNRFLDLNQMYIDFDDGRKKIAAPVLVDGKFLLEPRGVIMAQGNADVVRRVQPEFLGERFKMPVGILCTMKTEDGKMDFALSVMDVVQMLVNEECRKDFVFMYSAPQPEQLFKGLEFRDGSLVVDGLEELEELSLPYVVSNMGMKGSSLKGYLSTTVKEFCLKSKIAVGVSYLSALQKFLKEDDLDTLAGRLRFKDLAGLKKNIFSGCNAVDCLQFMLFEQEWEMLAKAAVGEDGSAQFLQRFLAVFLEEFRGDLAFLEGEAQVQAVKEDEDEVIKKELMDTFAPLGTERWPLKDGEKVVGVLSQVQMGQGKVWVVSLRQEDVNALTGASGKYMSVAKMKSTYLQQVIEFIGGGKALRIRFVDRDSQERFVAL